MNQTPQCDFPTTSMEEEIQKFYIHAYMYGFQNPNKNDLMEDILLHF